MLKIVFVNRHVYDSQVKTALSPLGSLSNHDGDGKENATLKVNSRCFALITYPQQREPVTASPEN